MGAITLARTLAKEMVRAPSEGLDFSIMGSKRFYLFLLACMSMGVAIMVMGVVVLWLFVRAG